MVVLAREFNISWAADKPLSFSILTQSKFTSPSCYNPLWVSFPILCPSHLKLIASRSLKQGKREMQEISLPVSALSDTCHFLPCHMAPCSLSPSSAQFPVPCMSDWEPQVWWRHLSYPFDHPSKLLPNTEYCWITYFTIVKISCWKCRFRGVTPGTMTWDSAFSPFLRHFLVSTNVSELLQSVHPRSVACKLQSHTPFNICMYHLSYHLFYE